MTTTTKAAPSIYFASGSNRAAEIRGFARIGHAIGVAAPEVMSAHIRAELIKAGRIVPLFVDSGAFSEVEFNAPHECGDNKTCNAGKCIGAGNLPHPDHPAFTFKVVKPITDADFDRIFDLYEEFATELGSNVHVVAPDQVGNQAVTLERLARFAPRVRRLRELGANVLVAIQRGALSQADFARACAKVLGFDDFVCAMPLKKGATTHAELVAFVADFAPARMHLLGMGPRNRSFQKIMRAALAGGATVTADSMLICASVGRSNGRKSYASESLNGRRVYTIAQDMARDIIAAGLSDIADPRELGIVLAFSPVADEAARWAIIEARCARKAAAA